MTTITLFAVFACSSPALEAVASPAEETAPADESAPAEAPATLVSGTIEAPAELPTAAAVFVSLKNPAAPGPPIAAKKLPAGPFPMSFTLTEADRPMNNGPVPDALQLKATLDVDGNPMSKSPADLEAVVQTKRGTTELSVTLAPR